MKQTRRLQQEKQFNPANAYSSIQEQQPMMVDHQYGQSLNQQPRAAFTQRHNERAFQPSEYRR